MFNSNIHLIKSEIFAHLHLLHKICFKLRFGEWMDFDYYLLANFVTRIVTKTVCQTRFKRVYLADNFSNNCRQKFTTQHPQKSMKYVCSFLS